MAAAIPLIGTVIVAAVVSKVVQEVGEKIGLSENMSQILGVVAGAYTGNMAYGAMTSTPETGAVNMPTAGQGTTQPSVAGPADAPVAPSAALDQPFDPSASPYTASAPPPAAPVAAPERTGMLSETSAIQPAPTTTQVATPPVTSPTSTSVESTGQQSWVERLFSPEKTMDLVMAGMSGYAEAGMAQEVLEYPEEVKKQNAAGWAAAYPGKLALPGPRLPSQQ